jgi:cation diffusion facilitator CzcD-associated flavoprotein CzcO
MGSSHGQAFGQLTVAMDASVIIVGAGFSGMAMAIELQKAGIDFLVLEKGNEFGGTWRDNVYPGAACDVPSHMYCLSYEPYRWSRSYAKQPEILDYQKYVAKKYHLYRDTRFNAAVKSAEYNDQENYWTVTTATGEVYRSRVMVSARGALHIPTYPNLPGLHDFKGIKIHSAQWDHSVDLTGKRVALIGTGASAIQVVPEIAKIAGQLTVFQRTSAWVLPKLDYRYKEETLDKLEKKPLSRWLYRKQIYWTLESSATGFVVDPRIMKIPQMLAYKHLRVVKDKVTRAALTPSYTMGCKRILMSNSYLQAFNRPNVTLVGAVDAITENTVVSGGISHEVDVIVFCTGFDVTDQAAQFSIKGKGGLDLSQHWEQGMHAYLGITTHNFPNAYFMAGPNTGLGHNSIIIMIEAQARYIGKALKYMKNQGIESLEVKQDDENQFSDKLHTRMGKSVWTSGCASWYLDASGKNTTVWPSFTFDYVLQTRAFNPSVYDCKGGVPESKNVLKRLLQRI